MANVICCYNTEYFEIVGTASQSPQKVFEVFKYHVQYLKVFNYLVQYLVFKYYLNSAQSEVFYKVFKYSGQSICPNTVVTNESDTVTKTMRLICTCRFGGATRLQGRAEVHDCFWHTG